MTDHSLTIYQQLALQTRALRQAAGRYPTPRQKSAFAHYLVNGIDDLTQQEIDALVTHPYLLAKQRAEFAAQAA